MSVYNKNTWIDHIQDIDTGEILQQGTLYCARLMNHMEDGIYLAHEELIALSNTVMALVSQVDIMNGSLSNNMAYNNFLEDFETLDDVELIDGIYDEIGTRLYY